jgi:hypothetical protein
VRTMYLAFSHTEQSGMKIGDHITCAHAMRLMMENDPCERYVISLNPRDALAFVFDQIILEFNMEVVFDDWPPGDTDFIYRNLDERRRHREVNGIPFHVYKELYLRIHGGLRQGSLCGHERGLGHRNIHEYYTYGQETCPHHCFGSTTFSRHSLGFKWRPTASKRSCFVAPHAFSQTNSFFTLEYWGMVIEKLLAERVAVTVNTHLDGRFGTHPLLTYSFKPGDLRGLFDQIGQQRLVVCGNTGIGWIAGAHGVPLIAGEPHVPWQFQDYRYRECGVQSLVGIFDTNDPGHAARMAVQYLDNP